jgi:hypothetical protein
MGEIAAAILDLDTAIQLDPDNANDASARLMSLSLRSTSIDSRDRQVEGPRHHYRRRYHDVEHLGIMMSVIGAMPGTSAKASRIGCAGLSNLTVGRLRIPIATGRHGRAAPFLRDDHEQLGISGSTPPGYDALR